MSQQKSLYSRKCRNQWVNEVTKAFPNLSKPESSNLADLSFGMVVARSCALATVAFTLAKLFACNFDALRQRFREFYKEADKKKGKQRRTLDITTCFAFLLQWIVRDWSGKRLAIALDASALGSRFTVLCISVVYRGAAIPVAWKILKGNEPGSWKPLWIDLLRRFKDIVPEDWEVIALADRGLYAKWLFHEIRSLKWHPFLRINLGGTFRPQGFFHWMPLRSFATKGGPGYQVQGTAFKTSGKRLECTLLAYWGEKYEDPWLILTDLPPQKSDVAWYKLRSWIEQFFKDGKRGGWQWQKTRMENPERAERMWLAVAVATLWLVRVGGEAEHCEEEMELPATTKILEEEKPKAKRWRLISVFASGFIVIIVALINHERFPKGKLIPEPWPISSQEKETRPKKKQTRKAA